MKKLAIAAVMFASAVASQATPVVGSTFVLQSDGTFFGVPLKNSPSFVVGSGLELSFFEFISLDVSANSVTFTWVGSYDRISYFNGGFNGFRLMDVQHQADDFTSVALGASTNVTGFDASRISFTGDEISIDVQNLSMAVGERIVVDFNTAAATNVPEPASLALFSLGLAGLAVARRKYR